MFSLTALHRCSKYNSNLSWTLPQLPLLSKQSPPRHGSNGYSKSHEEGKDWAIKSVNSTPNVKKIERHAFGSQLFGYLPSELSGQLAPISATTEICLSFLQRNYGMQDRDKNGKSSNFLERKPVTHCLHLVSCCRCAKSSWMTIQHGDSMFGKLVLIS